jgi:hypothetical protein
MSGRPIDGNDVAELRAAVEQLSEHVQVLYNAIDEFRDLMGWALHNQAPSPAASFQLTSMPADPAASDWAKHVNKFTAADVPEPDRPTKARYQGNLWSFDKD